MSGASTNQEIDEGSVDIADLLQSILYELQQIRKHLEVVTEEDFKNDN